MKYVVITGASRGLGKALLDTYWQDGDFVFPIVRSETSFKYLHNRYKERCCPILGDVTDENIITLIRESISKYSNKLDLLINNAGISGDAYQIESTSKDEIMKLFEVHCFGALNISKACIPFLDNSTLGKIINISSRLGSITKMSSEEFIDRGFSYSYRIAKASQNMMSVCLNNELRNSTTGVVSIHPGQLQTDSGSNDANETAEDAANRIKGWIEEINNDDFGRFIYPGVKEFEW